MKEGYKVYFAGPDVFSIHAKSFYAYAAQLARISHFVPLIPWNEELAGPEQIFQNNIRMLQEADGAVANLAPFHGMVEPDSGTVWEVGYLAHRQVPIVGYSRQVPVPGTSLASVQADSKLADRVRTWWRSQGHPVDAAEVLMPDDHYVENFGMAQNLMVQRSLLSLTDTLATALYRLECEFSRLEAVAKL